MKENCLLSANGGPVKDCPRKIAAQILTAARRVKILHRTGKGQYLILNQRTHIFLQVPA